MPMLLPSKMISPDAGLAMPAMTSSSSDCPLPETPAMPTISPARRSKETLSTRGVPLRSRHVRFLTSSTTAPGLAAPFSTRSSTRRPTISSASSPTDVSLVSLVATISPRRMTETWSVIAMISRSLWVMRMTVLPWSRRVLRMRKRWSASSGVSTPVGSSRIKTSGALEQRLQDLDPLLQAHGKFADDRIGIDIELVVVRQPRQLGARLGAAPADQRAALRAEHDVLEHGEGIDQHEVLMHHADAARDGVRRRPDADGLAVDLDLALVGGVEAEEDRHQRRFAGAVLADDAVDRALADGERHVLVGVDRAEALVDADELDGGKSCSPCSSFPAKGEDLPKFGWSRVLLNRALVVRHVVMHLHGSGDDIRLGLLDRRRHLRRYKRLVVVVHGVADAVLRQAEGLDAALERAVLAGSS